MTLLAFLKFAREKVDCAVVEVGLGGRIDSTNVVNPELSIISSIGLDHTQMLGHTVAEIAAEKAGIIKEHAPVVCGWLPEAAMRVAEIAAAQKSSHLFRASDYFKSESELPRTSLFGLYQRKNAAVAALAMRILRGRAHDSLAPNFFREISDSDISSSLMRVEWAARWQTIRLENGAELILDSSHNEEGARALESNLGQLCSKLESGGKSAPIICVGVLGIERAVPLLKVVEKYARKIVLLVPNQPRALGFDELRKCIDKTGVEVIQTTVGELFKRGLCTQAAEGDTVVSTGSIYLAGEVLAAINGERADGMQDLVSPK